MSPWLDRDSPFSAGEQTDLLIHEETGRVEDKPDYIVVKTPGNPGFYYGNYLLLKSDLAGFTLTRAERAFQAEFGSDSAIAHVVIAWPWRQGPQPPAASLDAGYDYQRDEVLCLDAQSSLPPAPATALVIREFASLCLPPRAPVAVHWLPEHSGHHRRQR